MQKAVLYARVSSKEQEREGYSIQAQIELLKNYADKNSIKIVAEFIDVETAKQAGRTNFNEMLKFLKKNNNIKAVLVEKTDRLYRNFNDYVTLAEIDIEAHLVKEGEVLSKNSTSHAKFMHEIKLVMAKNYIDNLIEETKKGMQAKVQKGEWPNKEPYGYKRLDKNTVVPNPETAPLIKRAFEIYSEGNVSLEKTCDRLKEEGYFYRPYQQKIHRGPLERMLKNIFYTGKMEYKGEIYNGNHEPIISKLLFDRVQIAFKKDNKPLYRKREFMFGNMIKCGVCGCSIVAEMKKGKYVYYHCTWGKGKSSCNQTKHIPEKELEVQFEEAVKKVSTTPEQKEWIIKALKMGLSDEQTYHKEQINRLHQQIAKIKERNKKLLELRLDEEISADEWKEDNNKYKEQLETLLNQIKAHEKANNNCMDFAVQTLELAEEAYNIYLAQPSEEKANILKDLLSNCTLKDGKLSYEYKKPFDILAKGLSCNKWLPLLDNIRTFDFENINLNLVRNILYAA